MAENIEEFKRDLEQLKNQRSVIQAKLDEATRHVEELKNTLKGMGFNSIEEAKAAYLKQKQDAEKQHELVKKLIQEINQVDSKCPTREDVQERLNSLSAGNLDASVQVQDVQPVAPPPVEQVPSVEQAPLVQPVAPPVQTIPAQPIPEPVQENPVNLNVSSETDTNNELDLGNLLFASL